MDKANYQVIFDGIFNVLKDKGFKKESFEKGEYLSNGKKAFLVDYNEDKKLIYLKSAQLEEDKGVEWSEVSSWLFDENTEDRDKETIKNDFCDSCLEQIGAKAGVRGIKKVEMPSKKKKADTIDVESFSARFLAMFPEYKDAYKENVSKYGEFMYDDFFSKYGVEAIKKVFDEGNKRHVSKYFELLNLAYVSGDEAVASTVVYSIFATIMFSEKNYEREIDGELEKLPYLKNAVRHTKSVLSSEGKRAKYL